MFKDSSPSHRKPYIMIHVFRDYGIKKEVAGRCAHARLQPYSVETAWLIKFKKQNGCWRSICRMAHFTDTETTKRKLNRGVAWERFAHPHTDPQAQICHLQYVIYRACIRLLPSFSDFLSPTLRVSLLFFAPSHAQIFSQVIQITVAYLICHAWLSPQDYRGLLGFFYTQPPSLNFCIFTLQN